MHFPVFTAWNSNFHIHIVSLYKLSLFHPELPLSPHSPPSLFLSLSNFPCPPLSFLSLTRCLLTSCAQMAEKSRQDGFGVCTHSNAQTDMHANIHAQCQRVTCYSRDPGLLSPSRKISFCFHFFPTSIHRVWPHQYRTDAPNSRDCRQTWVREGQEFGRFCTLIGLVFLFCVCVTNRKVIRLQILAARMWKVCGWLTKLQ